MFWVLWSMVACGSGGDGPVAAPSGFSDTVEAGGRVVQKGSVRVAIGPWEPLGDATLRDWLAARAGGVAVPGGRIVSTAEIKPEERFSGVSVNRVAEVGGESGQSVVIACPGQPGFARLLHLSGANRQFTALMRAGMFAERVCVDEPKGGADEASAPTSAPPPPSAPPPSAPPPKAAPAAGPLAPARPPRGLRDIRGVLTMGLQPGGMFGTTEKFIATFDDGTYTKDLQHAFGAGVAASRRDEPRDWGHYRLRGGKIQLKDSDDDAFEDTRGSWLTQPSDADGRLSGCYGRLTSSSGADYISGTTVGLAASWCFTPDGRFTHDATAFGSSADPSGVVASTRPTARGRYRLDGYAARFVYDDGHEIVAAFCFANEDRDHIMLNGRRFMGR